ncbi:hypothetical protein [Motiliproteus sp. SC1-56]|uniref:hypothetical protein n=1 Tax=Motiliproteus sp. SC1-56 TaxID=2799565 RepID=UPI001A8C99F3|nr:hypothetical protein [Motiliproteus sp. SC1-56]
MSQDKTFNAGSWLAGLVTGLALTVAYIKFGYTLPAFLQPTAAVQGKTVDALASLAVDRNNLAELQRELALDFRNPDRYLELDSRLGGFITEEVIWLERTRRDIKRLQDGLRGVSNATASASILQQRLETLPGRRAAERRQLRRFLQQRFAGLSDAEIARRLVRLSLAEVLQQRPPFTRIWLHLPAPAPVRLVIYNAEDQPIRELVNGVQPAGQYRFYWNFTDDAGAAVNRRANYRYQIWVDGQPKQPQPLPPPAALF